MSSFFSQMQHIPNTWWHLVKQSGWSWPFDNLWSEYYRREQEGIQRMNEILELATRIRRNYLEGIFNTLKPNLREHKPLAGTTVEDLPEPDSLDCQLPGG